MIKFSLVYSENLRYLFTVTCPSLTGYDFLFSCSNNNDEGSVCELRCFSKQNLIGNRIIRCENNGEWSPSFEETTCRNRISKKINCLSGRVQNSNTAEKAAIKRCHLGLIYQTFCFLKNRILKTFAFSNRIKQLF